MIKKNKNHNTLAGLLPYFLALIAWAAFCVYFIQMKIIDDSIIYPTIILPTSLITLFPLWLYTKSRRDPMGIVVFNWISTLVLSNFVVFCMVYVLTFQITF